MKKLIFTLLLFAVPTFAQAPVFTKLNTTAVAVATFVDPAATHNATYQYYVTEVNSAGVESAPSATITIVASITQAVTPTPAEVAGNIRTITLTWVDTNTGVTFNVYRKLIAGPPIVAIPPTPPTNLAARVS